MSGGAARRAALGVALTLALLLRALTPAGYMPDLAQPGHGFLVCHGSDPGETPDGPANGRRDCPCAFLAQGGPPPSAPQIWSLLRVSIVVARLERIVAPLGPQTRTLPLGARAPPPSSDSAHV